MFAICQELGLSTYPQFDNGDVVLELGGRQYRFAGQIPKIGIWPLGALGLGVWRLDRLTKRVTIETPWTTPRASRLDSMTLEQWITNRFNVPSKKAQAVLRAGLKTFFCCEPAEVSLLGGMVLAAGGGGFRYYADTKQTETHLIDGGVPEVATRMADGLGNRVRLSTPVREAHQFGDRVEVRADGRTVAARRAIVAVPPLLASQIEFAPALPSAHANLLRSYPPGAVIKTIASYHVPFWRGDGLTGETVAPDSPVSVSIDQSPLGAVPGVLTSFAVGRSAIELAGLGPDERRKIWLGELAKRLGPAALTPGAYLETDWSAEAWSLGGLIGHLSPGVLTSCGTAIREPVGNVYWAGTERATVFHGLIEGAVRSGERVAEEILPTL
jgi:monoamine oxidase